MSRSGLGNECEFSLGFDKAYESPPQPHLLGSQSTFTPHSSALSPENLNYPHEIISHSDASISPTAILPSTSTNTLKKHRGQPYGSRNEKPRMNIVYGNPLLLSH